MGEVRLQTGEANNSNIFDVQNMSFSGPPLTSDLCPNLVSHTELVLFE